jgi:minichromosome maintenance protein 10
VCVYQLHNQIWSRADRQAGSAAPHPLTLPLALNPTSGEHIRLIGQAKDLGRCSAVQKDGNRCRTWVDLYVYYFFAVRELTTRRENAVCEYHVHTAVQKGRAGRAEFTAR